MTRYLVQIRLVKLPNPDDEPDRWSSATSTMTEREVSVPFEADYFDESPNLATSQVYLDAVTRAIGLLANPPDPAPELWVHSIRPGRCGQRWPLLDPSPEDTAAGITHQCVQHPDHDGEHLCTCGSRPGDD